jgi:LmbE family N-acetylglucosaminyl deacetylase
LIALSPLATALAASPAGARSPASPVAAAAVPAPAAPTRRPEPGHDGDLGVAEGERLLVIAPHPDDESIAAAGLMQRVVERGGSVVVVLVTAGDGYVPAVRRATRTASPAPDQFIAYGERRVGESRAAMRAIDPRRISVELLGFPDGGLDRLLRDHWRGGNPWRSRTTGASDPPYDRDALAPDVPYDGSHLRAELARVVARVRPTTVVLPNPQDLHPDHRAAAIFGLLAIADAHAGGGAATAPHLPRLLSYLVHWHGWPDRAAGAHGEADADLELPADLPGGTHTAVELALSDRELARKRAAMALYATQQAAMGDMLAAFLRASEPFLALGPGDVAAATRSVPPAQATSATHRASR